MKKFMVLIIFSVSIILSGVSIAQKPSTTIDSHFTKIEADSLKMLGKDSSKKAKYINLVKADDSNSYGPKETIRLVIVVAFFLVMILLLLKFFSHLKDNNQRIGYQSIKLIGLILIFPGICVLAIVGEEILSGQTLAVLLGTIAGYVLSREDDAKENTSLDGFKKREEDYLAKIKALEDIINSIKVKNPNLIA